MNIFTPLTVATLGLLSAASLEAKQPNILFLFSDDHARNALSAYAGEDALMETPNLDRLANEGVIFERNFVTNSICGPSRAVILTGKHSHINGMLGNERFFDGSQPTLPKYMREAGYETAIVGKWHLLSEPTGFDFWKVLPGQGYYYNPDFRTQDGMVQIEGHSTDIITDEALDWLENERNEEKPFFLMAQYKAPHRNFMPHIRYADEFEDQTIPEPHDLLVEPKDAGAPFDITNVSFRRDVWDDVDLKLPMGSTENSKVGVWKRNFERMTEAQRAEWDAVWDKRNAEWAKQDLSGDELQRARYQRFMREYLRTVRGLDDNIGRILNYLDESGLADNTLVIYSTDQGFHLGERGLFDKRWMYETTFTMPLIVRWPGVTQADSRIDELTQNLDYAPTLLEIAGVEIPEQMQGVSLLSLLKNPDAQLDRKVIYYAYHDDRHPHAKVPAHEGIRTEHYKLIHFPKLELWELYDLAKDPDERENRAEDPQYATLLTKMKEVFEQVRDSYDAPAPGTLRIGPFAGPRGLTKAPYLGERYWEE